MLFVVVVVVVAVFIYFIFLLLPSSVHLKGVLGNLLLRTNFVDTLKATPRRRHIE